MPVSFDEAGKKELGDVVTIKLTLHSQKRKPDLEIFRDFHLVSNRLFWTVLEDGQLNRKRNARYRALARIPVPTDREIRRMERMIRRAWEQYIRLYEKGIPRWWINLLFDCEIIEETEEFRIDPKAVYVELRHGKARPVYLDVYSKE